jgi:hypothetical protein
MKKTIVFLSLVLAMVFVGCKSTQITKHNTVTLYGYWKPISDFLPGTELKIRGNEKDSLKVFKLVELTTGAGEVVLCYVSTEVYNRLQMLQSVTDTRTEKTIRGYLFSASPLGNASIISKKILKEYSPQERMVMASYQNQEKYIIWSEFVAEAPLGIVNAAGKIVPQKTNSKG